MKNYKVAKGICLMILISLSSHIAFSQADNFVSWSMNATYLEAGKLKLQNNLAGQQIKFTVNAQKQNNTFPSAGLTFKLGKVGPSDTSPVDLTSLLSISASDFSGANVFASKEFTITVSTAGSANTKISTNDDIVLVVADSGYPNGYFIPNTHYLAAVAAAPSSGTLAAPTNLVATVLSATRVYITWQDNSNNETGFAINKIGGNYDNLISFPDNATSGLITTLSPGVTITIAAQAYQRSGNSSFQSFYSNPVTVTMPTKCKDAIDYIDSPPYFVNRAALNSITMSGTYSMAPNALLNTVDGPQVVYTAGQSIRMLPNTIIQSGSNFRAYISSCSTSSTAGRIATQLDSISLDSTFISSIIVDSPLNNYLANENNARFSISPNPASESTIIQYRTLAPGSVKLTVIDNTGRVVSELINKSNVEVGNHELKVDTKQWNPGLYIFKLNTSSFNESLRLVVK